MNPYVCDWAELKILAKFAKIFTKMLVFIDQQNFAIMKLCSKFFLFCKISYHIETIAMQIKSFFMALAFTGKYFFETVVLTL